MSSLYDILFGNRASNNGEDTTGVQTGPKTDGSLWQLLQNSLKAGNVGNDGDSSRQWYSQGPISDDSTRDLRATKEVGSGDIRATKEVGRGADEGGGSDVTLKFWKPENPDWENVQPEMKGATTSFVGDIQNRFGKDKDPWITSGYRSPKTNDDTPGAAKNSWHMKGLAVDMNLEDYSPDERKAIEQIAQERFGEVLFHDAGTGMHLHIANPLASK